jgi:hypothetical protein
MSSGSVARRDQTTSALAGDASIRAPARKARTTTSRRTESPSLRMRSVGRASLLLRDASNPGSASSGALHLAEHLGEPSRARGPMSPGCASFRLPFSHQLQDGLLSHEEPNVGPVFAVMTPRLPPRSKIPTGAATHNSLVPSASVEPNPS